MIVADEAIREAPTYAPAAIAAAMAHLRILGILYSLRRLRKPPAHGYRMWGKKKVGY
jgi:hypothetical protein